jgi:hypothetical protein
MIPHALAPVAARMVTESDRFERAAAAYHTERHRLRQRAGILAAVLVGLSAANLAILTALTFNWI